MEPSTLLLPLAGLIKDAAKDFVKERITRVLEVPLGHNQIDTTEFAVQAAYEARMTAIFRSLQATGWEDEELRLFFSDYHQAWQSFLQDPEASELLLAPLGSVSADFQLDVAGLLTRWEVLGRNPLPKTWT